MKAEIIDTYKTEEALARIARVSTDRADKELPSYKALVQKLVKEGHWSVLEFAQLTIEIEAPIYVLRQWMRHSGAWIELSRRYTKGDPTYEEGFDYEEHDTQYKNLLLLGYKPEEARKVLPMATYTKAIWQPNLRDFLFFCKSRVDRHAQQEIRELAERLFVQAVAYYPEIVFTFLEYEMGAKSLSALDLSEGKKEAILKYAKTRIETIERINRRIYKTYGIGEESS